MSIDISVVVAAKNEEKYVVEALQSIIDQDNLDIELIFIDDNSTDNTYQFVHSMASKHSNIRLEKSPFRGKVAAFNYGVSLATGRWVCLFAGDDVMPPESLAKRLAAVEVHKKERATVGLCRLVTMSEDQSQDGHVVPKSSKKGGFTGTSYLMNAASISMLFPIPEHLPNEDTWLQIGMQHLDIDLIHNGIIGNKWRVHSGNSINMQMSFSEYNSKLTPRMAAFNVFLERHAVTLSHQKRKNLEGHVACENARKNGDAIGIMMSNVLLVERLRALSASSAFWYALRKRAYGLFSGW